MLQKDRRLALQVDVTATPRHDNGAIFVQTVSDYPLVEAIHQNVVKHPVLPDAASRAQAARAQERHLHREVRRLPAARRRGMAQELRRARGAGQEGGAVRHGGRHPQLRRGRRVSGEDLPRAARRGAGHPHQEQRRDLRSGLGQEQGRAGDAAQGSRTRSTRWESPLQGHRLRPDAQGRLGRAQRHHHRRPARLRRQEQHPAGADPGSRPAPHVLRHRRAAKPSR